MAEVTQEDIIEVFGSVGKDYADKTTETYIPPETWRNITSALSGIEKSEFDAFVDLLNAEAQKAGREKQPDIRASLVAVYKNLEKEIRKSPRATGRTDAEVRRAVNRTFSKMRQALRSPEAIKQAREQGLATWVEENADQVIAPNDGGVSDDPLFTVGGVDMLAGTATPYPYQPEPSRYGDALAQREALRAADPDAPFQSRWRDNREGPLGVPINTQSASAPTPFRLDFSGQGLEPTFDPLASPDATLADRQAAEDFLYSLPPEQRARFGPPGGKDSVFSEEQITAVINARRGRYDPQRAFPTTVTETEVEAITPAYDPNNPAAIGGLDVPTLSMDPRLSRNMNLDRDVDLNQMRLQAMMADLPAAQAPPPAPSGTALTPQEAAAKLKAGGYRGLDGTAGNVGADGVPEMLRRPPDAGLLGTGTQGEGAPPSEGMSGMSLASGIIGGVGIAGAIANTITDFRTTAALEDMLADSAAGNTVARQEGQLMGGQLQRNIMASSRGRRDISPALALRNAQQAAAPAMSDMYGQAAIESARERRESEAGLAQLRKQRYDSLFGSLMQTAGTVGSMLATQGANKETEDMRKRMEALERRALVDVTTPGRRVFPTGGR